MYLIKIIDLFRLTVVVLAASLLWPTAEAQAAFPVTECAADRFGSDLNCTANDVSITGMAVVGETTSCVGGANVTLDLQMTINYANPNRYDIGIFISNDGKSPQFTTPTGAATCDVSALPPFSPFWDLNTNACGDGGGNLSGIHYMSNVTVPCQSLAGAGGNLYIPYVVSWNHQSSGTCDSKLDVVPSGIAKCNSPTVTQGSVAVVVLPTITMTDGKTTIFSGGTTSYTVTITNTTGAVLSGAVFKDPAVNGIAAGSLSCVGVGGSSCPGSSTISAMQGAGITIPDMPVAGSVTFTIGATLTGSPGNTRTNTATVTVGSQSSTASDTDTIVDTIAILPSTQSKNVIAGSVVSYSYTLYNFGVSADTISIVGVSSKGWAVGVSPTPVSVPAGGSTVVTVMVSIPGGATLGDVDVTTITATSGNFPSKTATAAAVTTVATVLTLTPSNTGSGGSGSYVYYTHRVQSNASISKIVSLVPSFTGGTCTNWSYDLFESNKTTALSSPVTLAANGGYKDFVLRVFVSAGAVAGATCTATLTAQDTSTPASTVTVTDVTTVKNLVLYEDPGYNKVQSVYPTGKNVYAKAYGLNPVSNYEYRWYDSAGTEVCLPRQTSTVGATFPSTCAIPVAGPLGTWTVQVWNLTAGTKFLESLFYVGPDHINATYGDANPTVTANAVVNLALHDKNNHVVPFDPLGNLVKGDPANPDGPLKITVTLSGSAQIVSTTLTGAVITGQTVTGKLISTTGTATLTITDSVAETVTVTPGSYNGMLWGSPVRDEPTTVTFDGIVAPHHLEIRHGSGTGLTCASSTLTVRACADAACSSLYTGGVSGTLSASGPPPTVNWDGTTGAGAGFVIPVSSSSETKNVQVATAGTVTFGITVPTPAPSNATTCTFGNNSPTYDNCVFTANTAGFIFSNTTTGNTYTIPAQVSGIATPTLYLRAVQASTSNPAVCTPAIISQTTPVTIGYACNNPASCQPGNLTTINATAIAPAGTGVSLTFDANGSAPITARYDDVGQITLNANKTVTPFGGATAITLNGTSNAFVVKPHHFELSGIQQTAPPNLVNPGAANATDPIFVKAGEQFSVTVTARNFLNAATANYGLETTPESVKLTSTLIAPAGGNNPAVSGTFGAFSGGVATADGVTFLPDGVTLSTPFTWGEVGIITLTPDVTDGNYLEAGNVTGTTSGNVGRFYPKYFETVVTQVSGVPMDCPVGLTCPANYNGAVYSGQEFNLNVTAMNANGGITQNYSTVTGFAKSTALTSWGALGTTTAPTGSGNLGIGIVSAFVAGMVSSANETYIFTSPPTEPTDIYIRAIDTDNVSSLRVNPATSVEGGVKVVSGHVKVSNAYGSEKLALNLTASAQYYTANGWLNSTTDNSTTLTLPASYTVGLGSANVLLTPGTGTLLNGQLNISLTAPDVPGVVTVNPTVPAYLQLIEGTATFGVYKGGGRYIYQRESY